MERHWQVRCLLLMVFVCSVSSRSMRAHFFFSLSLSLLFFSLLFSSSLFFFFYSLVYSLTHTAAVRQLKTGRDLPIDQRVLPLPHRDDLAHSIELSDLIPGRVFLQICFWLSLPFSTIKKYFYIHVKSYILHILTCFMDTLFFFLPFLMNYISRSNNNDIKS